MPEPSGSGRRTGRPSAAARLALAAVLLSAAGWAQGEAAVQETRSLQEGELKALRERIGTLRGELERVRSSFDSMRVELRDTERRIGEVTRNLMRIDEELAAGTDHLREAREQRSRLTAALADQQRRVAEQVRAAYAMGREPQLKILLNQQDPASAGRMMAYFGYLSRSGARQLTDLADTLERVRQLEAQVAEEGGRLQALRTRRAEEMDRLEKGRKERATLIGRLNAEISDRNRQLDQMKGDERELESVIKALYEALADIPAEPGNRKPFGSQRGRLLWPTQGKLATNFGSPRSGGKLTWQGVLIRGKEGQPVRAVSHGRVAFADWLRGYGLVIVVDHDEGFMTLYGHNQSLYKEAGDWVEAGETIAALGNSGGRDEPVLYFEIRRNGQPTDPIQWCRR